MRGMIREYNGFELWVNNENDTAAICVTGETPKMDEYSTPYLVREWNRRTGDTLTEDEFYQLAAD